LLVSGKLDNQRVEVWSSGKQLPEYDLKDTNGEFAIPLGNVTVPNGFPRHYWLLFTGRPGTNREYKRPSCAWSLPQLIATRAVTAPEEFRTSSLRFDWVLASNAAFK